MSRWEVGHCGLAEELHTEEAHSSMLLGGRGPPQRGDPHSPATMIFGLNRVAEASSAS